MIFDFDSIDLVYKKLGDELSRKVYLDRVSYSIDNCLKQEMVMASDNEYFNEVFEFIRNIDKNVVVCGAGKRGQRFVENVDGVNWKCYLDNNKSDKKLSLNVYTPAEYKIDVNDIFFVTIKDGYEDVVEQLKKKGVTKDRIMCFEPAAIAAEKAQYFDLPYMNYRDEVFIDCGCWDGQTSCNLIEKCGQDKVKKVIAFEPMLERINICENNIEKTGADFRVIPKGLWDKNSVIYAYRSPQGMFILSDVYTENSSKSEATYLDEAIKDEEVTFIKMDIEGAELNALRGAENIIKRKKPKLAICVYHKREDIFEIPKYILSLNPGYRFYLRHYGTNGSETVLYALP